MHHKHMFTEIHNANYFSTQRPTGTLYLTVNKNEDTVTTNMALDLF